MGRFDDLLDRKMQRWEHVYSGHEFGDTINTAFVDYANMPQDILITAFDDEGDARTANEYIGKGVGAGVGATIGFLGGPVGVGVGGKLGWHIGGAAADLMWEAGDLGDVYAKGGIEEAIGEEGRGAMKTIAEKTRDIVLSEEVGEFVKDADDEVKQVVDTVKKSTKSIDDFANKLKSLF